MARKAQTQVGPKALRAVFGDAQRAAEEEEKHQVLDPTLPRNGIRPGQWEGYPSASMPPDCKVQIVGRDPAGGRIFAITWTGHFRVIEKFDVVALIDLFAPAADYLKWAWPAWRKREVTHPDTDEKKIVPYVGRPERDVAIEALLQEAARRGDFNPDTQRRGIGGWEDNSSEFVWHSGGWLWKSELIAGRAAKLQRTRPKMFDGYLYTRQATTIEPWDQHVSQEESPARRILAELRTWKWQRPYLDPVLVLGWIATALMGGALKARPILFTTGGAGVGKSTLLGYIRNVLADVCVSTVNTTAAGIYQRQKHDAIPFLIDELESKPGSTRAEAVIELMRVAYTGGDISRGGSDHEATTFTARNSFAAFAINAPPMGAQDKSRMAMLNLSRLDQADGIPKAHEVSPDVDGRMILRQIMDGWTDFNGRLMQDWFSVLKPHGLDSRAIDTFGTLLAAAELLVGPEALEEIGLPVTEANALGEMIAAATRIERSETLDNWHQCLDHLFQSSIDSWREGVKPTVGGVCDDFRTNRMEMDEHQARSRLQLVNLGIKARGKNKHKPDLGPCLAVPADGPALRKIFQDTDFHKGVWYAALKNAPKNIVVSDLGGGQKVTINGSTKHCLLVDLDAFHAFMSKGVE